MGMMMIEYPPRPRIARERAIEICDKHQVLRRPKGYIGAPRNSPSWYFYTYHTEYGHSSDSY